MHENLLEQVQSAIQIHEEASGPGVQALFIFDNSSTHATLPPDVLHAFDMNKSDGGKQCIQHDTVIPQSNLEPSKCGLLQKMTTSSGQPKGLQSVLEEWGFDLRGLKCSKCSSICPFESQGCCLARLLSQQDIETRDRAEMDRKIIQVQENKPERKQKQGTSVTGTMEEKQGQ